MPGFFLPVKKYSIIYKYTLHWPQANPADTGIHNMNTFTTLPSGWSLEVDGDDYTVYSPGQQHGGSLGCALECGSIIGDDSDIHIPPAVLRALVRHARALECKAVALRHVAPGEFILRSPLASKVYTRGVYDKGAKKYACADETDCSREILLDGDAIVYVDFSY